MLTEGPDTQTHSEFHRLTSRLRTRAHARRAVVEAVLVLVLAVGGGLLMWGGNFSANMVHDQLADQKIYFPEKGNPNFSAKEYPGLQQYAGQMVDNGPKAKAYANQFIAVHLKTVGGGQTYSQLATKLTQNRSDTALAAQVDNMFRGETLRGLLLYAWGWSVVGHIASLAAWAAFAGAAVVLIALGYGLFRPQHS